MITNHHMMEWCIRQQLTAFFLLFSSLEYTFPVNTMYNTCNLISATAMGLVPRMLCRGVNPTILKAMIRVTDL